MNVKRSLEWSISQQKIIGVTGTIGSAKSTYCKARVLKEKALGNEAHHIDLDIIAHEILSDRSEPIYQKIRNEIVLKFGKEVGNSDGSINRKRLGKIVFSEIKSLTKLNEMMINPVITLLRKKLRGLHGLILIEGALLIEAGLTFLCNNQVVILNIDSSFQAERLLSRGLSDLQIERRIASQYNYDQKVQKMNERIQIDGYGEILEAEF